MTHIDEQTTSGPQTYKVIGTRPIRHDGVDKVTGRAKYGADLRLSGTLHGALLRSPHAHARIVSIDTSRAEALPGVRGVVTGADMPDVASRVSELGEGAVNIDHLSRNVLARDKVLYKGHAVAAVAADNVHIAEEAVRLIDVRYEVLPPVLDVLEAMRDDAPVLLDHLRTESLAGETGERPTNIAKHFRYEKGDVKQGFAEAAVVIEREFRTATVHQGYIEPHNATVHWNADGQITVWLSTQGAFTVRQQMADLLAVPVSRVKVVPMEIGGGFGGKIAVYLPPPAALLSKQTGRPVKLVMDRAACFEATGPTPGSFIRVKMGADAEGRITAAQAWLAYEGGAFPGSPINPGCMCVFACYDVPNGRVDGYDVLVNKPRTNAYRAPGATNAAFATETVIDELCEKLNLDPLEFRLKNAAREGTRRIDGPVYARIGMWETAEAIRESEHWNSRESRVESQEPEVRGQRPEVRGQEPAGRAGGISPLVSADVRNQESGVRGQETGEDNGQRTTDNGRETTTHHSPLTTHQSPETTDHGQRTTNKLRGRGIASGFWFNAGLKSSVAATVNPDGTVALIEGSTDIGGSRASIAMQLAETLGIAAEDVHPAVVDTDSVGYNDVTGGSRVTYATGWAAYEAGLDIRRQMVERAALIWDVDPEQVRFEDGRILGPDDQAFSFKELAARLHATGAPIVGRGTVTPNQPGGAFATHVVDVEVDPDTGKVEILRYTAAQDVGTAIHPGYVEGQMQGGVVQGIGWALNEEYFYDEQGAMRNAGFLDYRIPTCYDVPMIDTLLVEVPNPGHPYGVRGAGEVPIVPPPAAIANAIYRAVGVRMRELPMSPPRVLHEILKRAES